MFTKSGSKFNGFYRGTVLDNSDSDELGRLKIRVFGIFDEIASANLPWAVPAYPLFSGSGIGYGYFAVPEVGSFVWVFFEAGDLYQPVFFAEAPDAVHGIPAEAATNYPSRKVWKTKKGFVVYYDEQDEELKVSHPSGTSIQIDSDGNVNISSVGEVNIGGSTVNINP